MQAEILARSRELKDANRALQAASTAKNDFLSRVSHELRTPMNAILGFGELLSMGELTGEQREYVTMMVKAGQHLLLLLNDVLDIARLEGQNLTLSMEPVPVAVLVADAVELAAPLASSRDIRPEIPQPAGCPP